MVTSTATPIATANERLGWSFASHQSRDRIERARFMPQSQRRLLANASWKSCDASTGCDPFPKLPRLRIRIGEQTSLQHRVIVERRRNRAPEVSPVVRNLP